MQQGQLDQVIEIFRFIYTPDEIGGQIKEKVLIANEWAAVSIASRNESKDHDKLRDRANYIFMINYRPDIQPDDFIIFNGNTYNVRFIGDKGQRDIFLRIEAERGVSI